MKGIHILSRHDRSARARLPRREQPAVLQLSALIRLGPVIPSIPHMYQINNPPRSLRPACGHQAGAQRRGQDLTSNSGACACTVPFWISKRIAPAIIDAWADIEDRAVHQGPVEQTF